jgi:hypothetical protein
MLAVASSGTLLGIHAHAVQVEVNTGEEGKPETVLLCQIRPRLRFLTNLLELSHETPGRLQLFAVLHA